MGERFTRIKGKDGRKDTHRDDREDEACILTTTDSTLYGLPFLPLACHRHTDKRPALPLSLSLSLRKHRLLI